MAGPGWHRTRSHAMAIGVSGDLDAPELLRLSAGVVGDLFAVLDTAEVRRWLHLTERYGRDDAWNQMAMFMGQWVLRGPKVH